MGGGNLTAIVLAEASTGGGGRFGCFRESRGRRGGSYHDSRCQRSSARGSGNAEKASTARMEGFVALVIGHRSWSPLFHRGIIV